MPEVLLKPKSLYNPEGDDNDNQIIRGNTTGIFNINNVRYDWAVPLAETLRDEFWIPQKYSMADDPLSYKELSTAEKNGYDKILSFLIFLDSVQTQNVPRVANYVTSPELHSCLILHALQEKIHMDSYQYILKSLGFDPYQIEKFYHYWKLYEPLNKRNKLIMTHFNNFSQYPSILNFYKVLIANYLLEGLYFYLGFNWFYALAYRNRMVNTANIIRVIQRDEVNHLQLFKGIIFNFLRENKKEVPFDLAREIAVEMFLNAAQEEKEWNLDIFGEGVLGFDTHSINEYVGYLGNLRFTPLNLGDSPFRSTSENPFAHLELSRQAKGNFFESDVTEYNKSTVYDDWDNW